MSLTWHTPPEGGARRVRRRSLAHAPPLRERLGDEAASVVDQRGT